MRILHILGDSDPAKGGVIEGVCRLGDGYRALGHEQHLLTLDAVEDPWVVASPHPVYALGKPGTTKRFYPHKAIAWLRAHACEYDGIIVDGLWNSATLAAARVLPKSGLPYAVFPHGMLDPWFRELQPSKEWVKRQLFRVNEGPLLRGAKAVLFTTEQERLLARASWPGWRGIREQVVGFGTGEPPPQSDEMQHVFEAHVPRLRGGPYLLFLSRIHPKKGCEILLEGFANVAKGADLHLVVAGPAEPGYLAKLQSLAENFGIANQVHWPGMLEANAKWGALYGCEAMALMSYQENFGVVVAEAMACRRPVLISDQVNIHAAVSAAKAGFVCQTDARSVAQVLARFGALPRSDRHAMGEQGRLRFEQEFSMNRVAEWIVRLFENS